MAIEWMQFWRPLVAFGDTPLAKWLGVVAAGLAIGSAIFGIFRKRLRHQDEHILHLARKNDDLLVELRRARAFDPKEWRAGAEAARSQCNEAEAIAALAKGLKTIEPGLRAAVLDLATSYATLMVTEGRPAFEQALRCARLADVLRSDTKSREVLMVLEGISVDGLEKGTIEADAVALAERFARTGQRAPDEVVLELVSWCIDLVKEGRTDVAVKFAERALMIGRRELGDFHQITLGAQNALAFALTVGGRYNDALREAEATYVAFQSEYGANDPNTLRVGHLVAQACFGAGNLASALAMAEEVLSLETEHPLLGPDHEQTLQSAYLVLNLRGESGDAKAALPLAEELLQKERELLGPDDPNVLTAHSLVAKLRAAAGDVERALPEAEALLERALAHPILGPEHPDTLQRKFLVAQLRWQTGDADKALAEANDVLARQVANPAIGPEHSDALATLGLIAQISDQVRARRD
jgi:tetratricopeptide (TPR) repeat protein